MRQPYNAQQQGNQNPYGASPYQQPYGNYPQGNMNQ